MTQCKNCHHEFKGNFCPVCGQHSQIQRIKLQYIFKDLSLGLFNVDSGFWYTIRALYWRPGYVVKDYLAGKRVKYFMPVSMLIVLATIYSFLYHSLDIDVFQLPEKEPEFSESLYEFSTRLDGNYVYFTLAILPIMSFSSWLFFKKQRLNFAEHFILNTFAACQRLVMHIVFLAFLVRIKNTTQFNLFKNFETLLGCALTLWCFIQFFDHSKFKVVLLSFFTFFLTYVLLLTLLILYTYAF
ncbi:DUF3667 domain-containing protein [Leeuwenhoekiella aestuarii]|uniref:DUF3667 domain-containing protein n=1 Tax=Leeuwenhoekiella aestuarii TaxID=2249426 RepID=A0A4Q0NS37_9FLAO|nr:DUF3667 domain-containing protein [Leeuwenhoekiella aestuarii]RXG13244.1 putative protein DUF3667 [Leeuwenhoekiella aestuarii]